MSISAGSDTLSAKLGSALDATEAPSSLRAAFTVELSSDAARRVFRYDPRLAPGRQWSLLAREGRDNVLDAAAADWAAMAAPDARLFPDDLRDSLGQSVEMEDFGPSIRLRFRHTPSANDAELDRWAAGKLSAAAWMAGPPARFRRIDYRLPAPVNGPDGGKLTRFDVTYLVEEEPRFGMSFIAAFSLSMEGRRALIRLDRAYRARITEAEFFFSSRGEAEAFAATQLAGASPR